MRTYVLAVDPGDRHVGLADWTEPEPGIHCSEVDASRALGEVRARLELAVAAGQRVVLVAEEFQLYGDKAMSQVGSAMETSQMIGQLKMLAGQLGVPFEGQGALIKAATRAQLKARGIVLTGSVHAKDAGLHLCYYVLFNHLGLRGQAPRPASAGS